MRLTGAVVVHQEEGRTFLRYEDVQLSMLRPDSIQVRPAYVGICGSDLDQIFGETDPSFHVRYPHTLGHEWSGTVEEVGTEVRNFQAGDRIIGHGSLGGNRWFGVSTDGAMAESFHVPAEMCFRIPENVSFLKATLVEPLACSLNALRVAGGTDPAQSVVVLGCGAIGLTMIALASELGARVVAIDPSRLRLDLAQKLGAEIVVIHESNEKSLYELSNLTGFTGADLVVEASGVPSAQSLAIDVTGMNGRVLFMGLTHKKANDVSLYQVQNRNLRLLSSTGAPSHIWAPTLEFLSRTNLDLTPIVSDVYAFNECEMAINSARQSSLHAKIVLSPDGK